MSTQTSSIDEMLLTGTAPSTPPVSESKELEEVPELPENTYEEPEETPPEETEPEPEQEEEKKEPEQDDYGNDKAPDRTYTQAELDERINRAVRERLARGNHQSQQQTTAQQTQGQVAQKEQDFEYDPESADSWEAQLEKFVEKTVSKIGQRQIQEQQQLRDQAQQAEFEEKFNRGMSRFSDFREVVSSQPVTDPMTHALRGISDPAAFIYAASKRHPQELARISQIPDAAVQIMEMGRLEQSMRKQPGSTKAPKPVSRSRDDGGMPTKAKKSQPSIEDLIAKADAKKRQQLQQRRGR